MESHQNSFITSLLTANTWVLFLIFITPYLFSYVIPENSEKIFVPILGILAIDIWFVWIMIIGKELNKRLPSFLIKSTKYFNLCMVYLIIGFTLLMINSYWFSVKINSYIILTLNVLGAISVIYGLYFTSRSLKELEKKRNVEYSEYVTIGFWLLIILIGIWFIQPRIRNVILNPDYKEGVK